MSHSFMNDTVCVEAEKVSDLDLQLLFVCFKWNCYYVFVF